ncbi:MAG: phosphate signaling complex protein PhoU [Lachnospiraceae bacterium]|nr:phosphate signaling complex protein PhoU [Lachnospiraceae bacterium]
MSPRTNFENELSLLHENLEEMGMLVEQNLDQLFDAQESKDRETLETLRKNDRIVNDMERHIESKCLTLITKQQPVARDLRFISAALKVVTDIERAGDQIADIAELLLRLNMADLNKYSVHFEQMVKETRDMMHRAVDAFITRNLEVSQRVIKDDDMVDDLFNQVKDDVIADVKENKVSADECVDTLMIAKHLEKIADYAVNIGEWGVFQNTGDIEDIRIL